MQPAPVVYLMVTRPGATPVAMPVALVIVATEVLVLLQAPPGVASNNDTVLPLQTLGVPATALSGLMSTVVCAVQPAAGCIDYSSCSWCKAHQQARAQAYRRHSGIAAAPCAARRCIGEQRGAALAYRGSATNSVDRVNRNQRR